MLRCFSFVVVALASAAMFAQSSPSADFVYHSPRDGSRFHSLETRVLFRASEAIDASSLDPALVRIVGDQSGETPFDVTLADDGRTINLVPRRSFARGETVRASIAEGLRTISGRTLGSTATTFRTTELAEAPGRAPAPECEPIGVGGEELMPDSTHPEFPEFVTDVNDAPAPGAIFGSVTSTVHPYRGFNFILSNECEVLYHDYYVYRTWDFKRLDNGLLGFSKYYDNHNGFYRVKYYVMDTLFAFVDTISMQSGYMGDHHCFEGLANGHYLVAGYDLQRMDMSEVTDIGREDAIVAGFVLQELDADHNVVFQWRSWDHIDITDSYYFLGHSVVDYAHVNAFQMARDGDYLVSCRHLSQILKIDRETGEVIWRLGGKSNDFEFRGEHEENAPTYFSYQHDVRPLDNGRITIHDNGNQHPPSYSRAVEYRLDEDSLIAEMVWEFDRERTAFGAYAANSQRLPNGNTFINWGGTSRLRFTEVDPEGVIVWEASTVGASSVYRAYRQPWNPILPETKETRVDLVAFQRYDFGETAVSLLTSELWANASNSASVSRRDYGASATRFGIPEPYCPPYHFVVETSEIDSSDGSLVFDARAFPKIVDAEATSVYYRPHAGVAFEQLPTSFLSADSSLTISPWRAGEYVFGSPLDESAAYPPIVVKPETGKEMNQERDVRIEWTPRGVSRSYELEIDTSAEFAAPLHTEADFVRSEFFLEPPYPEQTYYWRVRATNAAGTSAWSDTSSFSVSHPRISIATPNGGELFSPYSYIDSEVHHNLDADTIVVDLYLDGEFVKNLRREPTPTGYFRWSAFGLTEDDGYRLIVRWNADTTVADTSDADFAIEQATDVEASDLPTEFKLYPAYPNPFNPSTIVRFDLPERAMARMVVYAISGERVTTTEWESYERGSHKYAINLGGRVTGVYVAAIEAVGAEGESFRDAEKLLLIK
ncbi:MAG: hypothetical protein GF419_11670 [Ignavibacteriales bacterium]|nr:hypothetical protein [Ignavibacteriales bacterium]